MVSNKPNLFIVGAPKCGTSFMYEFLATHPQIFMCPVKEPNYFDQDLQYISPRLSEEGYLSLFKKAKSEKIIGEASPWYLFSSSASSKIYQFNPDAKIIIMIRNPIDYMHSLHSENIYQGNEIIENFEEALIQEEARKNNINTYSNSNPKEGVYYKETAKYTAQIKRYLDIFGKDRVHIIIMDDLKSNPEKVCSKILNFLEVENKHSISVGSINSNKKVKNKILREFIMRPPVFIQKIIRFLIPFHGIRIYIQDSLKKINTKSIKRESINTELSRRLKKEFYIEIQELSKLLERDLTYWVK